MNVEWYVFFMSDSGVIDRDLEGCIVRKLDLYLIFFYFFNEDVYEVYFWWVNKFGYKVVLWVVV